MKPYPGLAHHRCPCFEPNPVERGRLQRRDPGEDTEVRPRRVGLALLSAGVLCLVAAAPAQAADRITEYPLPEGSSAPEGIATGPDGNLWFTEADKLGRITIDGAIDEFPVPTLDSSPKGIAAGPDGDVWFTEFYGNKIGRITSGAAST
jgi:streptogramin lyase